MADEIKKDYALLLDNLRHALYMSEKNPYTESGSVFFLDSAYKDMRSDLQDRFMKKRALGNPAFFSFKEYNNILDLYKATPEPGDNKEQINQMIFWMAHLAGWKRENFVLKDPIPTLSILFRDTKRAPKIYGQQLKMDLEKTRYKVIEGRSILYTTGKSVKDGVSEDTAEKSRVASEYIVMCNYHIVSEYCGEGKKQLLKKVITGFAGNIVEAERKRQQEGEHSLIPSREEEAETLCIYINRMMKAYDLLPVAEIVKKDWLLARSLSWLVIGAMLRQSLTKDLLENYLKPFLPETDEHGKAELLRKQRIPQCLTVVPSVNQTVGLVGRDDTVKKMRFILEGTRGRALVYGIGGVGKTAVMQWICNELKEEGKRIAWIKCGHSLKEDILILRTALGIPEDVDAEIAYSMIINAMDTQLGGELYLFLDDLPGSVCSDDIDMINSLNAHVMMTSRVRNDDFFSQELNALEPNDAADMFRKYHCGSGEKRPDQENEEVIAEIVNSVNRHTLLIELLAKAAWKKGGPLEDFCRELKGLGFFDVFNRKIQTKHDKDEKMTIEESVMRLYEISGLTEEQQHIMKLFSIFSPEKEIYYKVGEWADLDLYALDELVELAWLGRGDLEGGYTIHQIIKESLARQVQKQSEELKIEDYGDLLDKVIDTDAYLPRDLIFTKVRERLVFTEDIAMYLDERTRGILYRIDYPEKDKQLLVNSSELFNNIGGVYEDQGEYEKALEYYEKALSIRERVLGEGHPSTATTYNNIAEVYRAQGEYEKALEYYERALSIRERVLGEGHPDTATTYNNIAGVYEDQGEYEKALEYYEKALSISEQVLGEGHPSTAATYNNIAVVYEDQGEYEKALEYYEKAMSIRERVLGEGHPSTATTYNNIAGVYRAQGEYEKALEYYEKALSIFVRVLGEGHPSTATTYSNIAVVYEDQGEYEKALEYYEKALSIRERVLGEGHPDTATTYNNIAVVYEDQGEYEKALEYYEKALSIRERVLGEGHPDTATTYNNIGGVYEDQGEYEKALEYYEKALSIRERVLGEGHPSTAATYNNIAGVYRAQGEYEKALEYYEKDLSISERVLGEGHPSTATTYNNIAVVYRAQGEYEKALEYYEKALSIRERVLGEGHPSTATTYNNIAVVYRAQGEYEKALEYYEKALSIFVRVLGEGHLSTATTYSNIAVVYRAQGEYEKALEYYEKAHSIFLVKFGKEHPYTKSASEKINFVKTYLNKN